jgi:hypothetical protein
MGVNPMQSPCRSTSRRALPCGAFLLQALLVPLGGLLARADLSASELPVPKINEIARVDRATPPDRENALTATYILKTSAHATLGEAYVVVTDQTEPAFVGPLERLAKFHQATIVTVKDLGALQSAGPERDKLISDLRRARPRFVAIAPRTQSFTTEMLLGLWSVLTALSDDQRLPVFPGILAAPDQDSFRALVDRSINHHPQSASQLRPFVMGQVLSSEPYGQRSLQKVRMLRNLFADYGRTTHSLVILTDNAVRSKVVVAPEPEQWQVAMSAPGRFIREIPSEARPALDEASLLLLFGHGTPGTECSLDVSAFRDVKMAGKIVMSGDCYSAAPAEAASSPPARGRNRQPPRGDGENFAMLAVENGAVVFYGHMHENQGFPHLFPVLEAWMDGMTVGEAYQRQINAIMAFSRPSAQGPGAGGSGRKGRPGVDTNSLLYVVIGDPALQPLEKFAPAR